MICPVCRDEYRPGFTRCATCAVDLVETLDAGRAAPPVAAAAEEPRSEVPAVELTIPFSGFLDLDEARRAREALRARRVRALIVITDEHDQEEYWLRIAPADARNASAILGAPPEVEPAEASFKCDACGAKVGASDRACPGCGLEFDE